MVTDAWNVDRVNEFCEKYGLTLKITYQETDEVEENIVLAQSPKMDEEIYENDTVKVVVSKKVTVTTTTTTTTTKTTTNVSTTTTATKAKDE